MSRYPKFVSTRMDKNRRGVTLIETVCVIAVIGILAAILAIGIDRIRQQANTASSASNLRQWGIAMQLYSVDTAGRIPFEGDRDIFNWNTVGHDNNQSAWFNVLPPYAGARPLKDLQTDDERAFLTSETTIFRCPVAEFQDRRRPQVNFSYMINSQIYHPSGPAGTGNHPEPPVNIFHLDDPSRTVFLADGDIPARARGRGRHVADRHRGRANIVFADGRVQSFDADYLRTETMQVGDIFYTDNNKPDVIWNPWRLN